LEKVCNNKKDYLMAWQWGIFLAVFIYWPSYCAPY
jgi:hypothetical protein